LYESINLNIQYDFRGVTDLLIFLISGGTKEETSKLEEKT